MSESPNDRLTIRDGNAAVASTSTRSDEASRDGISPTSEPTVAEDNHDLTELSSLPTVERLNFRSSLEDGSQSDVATRFVSRARSLAYNDTQIGRYRIEKCLGHGSFGAVYLATDDTLDRKVAIKIPHARVPVDPDEDALTYEARILARIDYEAIVPIYDVGRLDDGRAYIVSKFIDGTNLAARLTDGAIDREVAVGWVARAALGLQFAHSAGVIHRDVKPANLLLDAAEHIFVADFGLALRESDVGGVCGFAGTAAYTSPEQARREGHRVDARSDLFSLGVVLYELLTHKHPFKSSDFTVTLNNVANSVPPAPRDIDPSIPSELERICLKAIAKRSDDRYASCWEFAADLQLWLESEASPSRLSRRQVTIKPRGLRAFDETDAEAFLELIPGTRGRDGLPESIRFWKDRIEAHDRPDKMPVGVLYGPSGSGKSSFVRAGLLPRLDRRCKVVFVEATPNETEARIVRGLQRVAGESATGVEQTAAELIRDLRQGRGLKDGEKVLIVIDQFEQWLLGRRDEARRTLEDALRQCDGERVQAILLVRDEFWMELTRFLRALEVHLVDGGNASAIDLFDLDHARKVLIALGRAYGRLPGSADEFTADSEEFIDDSLRGLAREGRILCVRLVLFAELLRSKPWTRDSLKNIGGVESIGATILEEAFSTSDGNSPYRGHRRAAREVLSRLLPEQGVDLKGHMVARERLVMASGYADRPEAFKELEELLDHQLRIITPADPDQEAAAPCAKGDRARFYQLSHDSLVPDLRLWLLRDHLKTLRGRAELRLQEFASLWSEDRKASFLPTTWEWLVLLLLTAGRKRTDTQKKMMRATAAKQAKLGLAALAVVALLAAFGIWKYRELQANSHLASLRAADIEQVPRIVQELRPYSYWALPIIRSEIADPSTNERVKLYERLALLDHDPSQADVLLDNMIDRSTPIATSLTIRNSLEPYRAGITSRTWSAALNPRQSAQSRFRAALGLIKFEPPVDPTASQNWKSITDSTADSLVHAIDESPSDYSVLVQALDPIRWLLIPRLMRLYTGKDDGRRSLVTSLLVEFARDDAATLAELALDADPDGFAKSLPLLESHRRQILPILENTARNAESVKKTGDHLRDGHRRALAAISLIRMNDPELAWPVFRSTPDPNARTFLIHHSGRYGVTIEAILKRLSSEKDPAMIRGLLLAVGLHPEFKDNLGRGRDLGTEFLTHPDPGVLGAAQWLLKQMPGEPTPPPSPTPLRPGRNWYVTREGHVMVVIDARHVPKIGRVFAISSKEITIDQIRQFLPNYWFKPEITDDPRNAPAGVIPWSEAINYCQWLDQKENIRSEQTPYPMTGPKTKERSLSADLSKTGYRLPTIAEFEYACRGGTTTRRCFGDDISLLHSYAQFGENSKLLGVGSLLPNDFGLFDMNGNVAEWTCDLATGGKVFNAGGSHLNYPDDLDSECISETIPTLQYNSYGFRIVRTIELDDKGQPK